MPLQPYVDGEDVSYWQDDNNTPQQINFNRSYEQGIRFAFIRAMFDERPDEDYVYNYDASDAARLVRSPYHFGNYTKPGAAQAQALINYLAGRWGNIRPVNDFEVYQPWGRPSRSQALAYLEPYVKTITDAWGDKMILYTNPDALLYILRPTPAWLLEACDLWVAHWGQMLQPLTGDWETWTFWQYTAQGEGSLYGVESNNIDLDRYNGTLRELYAYCGVDIEVPGPGELPAAIAELDARVTKIERFLCSWCNSVKDGVGNCPNCGGPGVGELL